MDEIRDPPNELFENRLELLNDVMPATVDAQYHGGSVFMLVSDRNEFRGEVWSTLDDYNFDLLRVIDNTVFIEKGLSERSKRDLERRAEYERQQELERRKNNAE